jgi:hypothetical protein
MTMLDRFNTRVQCSEKDAKLLVTTTELGDVLKARLPLMPAHPRALLTLLEGLALWQGQPLSTALSVPARSLPFLDSALWGDDLWPAESPLVSFNIVGPARRVARLKGVGDFRALRVIPGGRP